MFEAEMRHAIAQGEQEMIIAIVMRAEQRVLFLHQMREMADVLRRHFQGGGAVRRDVDDLRRLFAGRQINRPEIFPGDDRRIHQRFQRGG